MEIIADTFRVLSDSTRYRILMLLSKGERGVTSICTELRLAQPTTSHHLGLLRMAKFVRAVRKGKQIIYWLEPVVEVSVISLRIGRIEIYEEDQ